MAAGGWASSTEMHCFSTVNCRQDHPSPSTLMTLTIFFILLTLPGCAASQPCTAGAADVRHAAQGADGG